MNWLKNMSTEFYKSLPFQPPMKWFGRRLRDSAVTALVKMGLEWEKDVGGVGRTGMYVFAC
jgi:hypothetical protein